MSASATFTRPVDHLGSSLDGTVVLPGDQRFDSARHAWNLAVDQRPAAVIFPESAAAVAAALGYAARRGLRVAAQGTGHNAGPLGPLTDTVLLRTDRMRGIRIDPQARIARAEAGVVWLDLVQAAARHGLTGAGVDPFTGQSADPRTIRALLLDYVHAALSDRGDTQTITMLLRQLDDPGTGADRQRALFTSTASVPAFTQALAHATLSGYEPTAGASPMPDHDSRPVHAAQWRRAGKAGQFMAA